MLLFLLSRDELRALLHGLGYEVSDGTTRSDRRLPPRADCARVDAERRGERLGPGPVPPEEAWRFLRDALESDVSDVQGGTTAEGIHLGAMAGTVDIVLRCLTGMRALGPVLRFEPALPTEVKQLRFSVHYRGHRMDVDLAEDRIHLSVRPGGGLPVNLWCTVRPSSSAPGQST